MMRHDWIFDVLADLRRYAQTNDLPKLAAEVEVALRIAADEISAADHGPAGDGPNPSRGRPH